jgi:ABC-type phosphate transport system permease subunit
MKDTNTDTNKKPHTIDSIVNTVGTAILYTLVAFLIGLGLGVFMIAFSMLVEGSSL